MPTPATYTVPSTAVYRSADGKDSRRFKSGAVIDYGDAIKFGMVAAPVALPPIYGGLRPNPSIFAIDDDAVLSLAENADLGAGGPFNVKLYAGAEASPQGVAAETDLTTSADYADAAQAGGMRWAGSFIGWTDIRFVAYSTFAGPADSKLRMKWADAETGTFANIGATGVPVELACDDPTGFVNSGWITIDAAAKAGPVVLHVFTEGFNDSTAGAFDGDFMSYTFVYFELR